MLVDLSLSDEPATHSLGDAPVGIAVATLYICASQCSFCRGGNGGRTALMRCVEVAHGTAVTDYEVLEAPVIAQDRLKQTIGTTTGIVVETLVGAHYLTYLCILYQRLEGRHVGLPEVTHRHIGEVGRVTSIFRTAVYGIVLGTCPELTVFRLLRPLQALHYLHTHDTCQVGILAVGLLTASPTRITENVDVRCPDRETAHLHVLTLQVIHTVVVLGTELGTGDVEDFV